jgi:putative transposase
LVRKPRADAGRRTWPRPLHLLIEGLALRRPPPTAAAIHRQVTAIAQQQGWPVPSYSSVYALIQQLDPALVTLAHEGTTVYQDTFDLLYRREASQPNEIWQADHTPLDLWVRDDAGRPARPWLSVILDDYSRAVAGYRLSLQAPSALQTALTLREAIWRKADPRWHVCGIPATFYTDHGSDFTSRHMEQVGVDLHMDLVFSFPGRPRGRGRIERFFETLTQLFLCTLPGYTRSGAVLAPPALTLPELDTRLRTFLLEEYHRRLHGEIGMAPQDRWEAGGFLPRLPETLEQLDLLLLTVRTPRQVRRDGIYFQGLRYIDLTLAAYVGETVTIRYDPRDMAEIRVFYRERFLCRAICQELAGREVGLKEIVRARTERRRQLRAALAERDGVVDTFLAVHQPDPPPDAPEPPAPPASRLKRYYNE